GSRLQAGNVGRTGLEPHRGQACRHGPRGDEYRRQPFVPQVGDLAGDTFDRGPVDSGVRAHEARGADLHDYPSAVRDWAPHSSSSSSSSDTGGEYSKVKSPIRTSSPSFAPASASALSTPRRSSRAAAMSAASG